MVGFSVCRKSREGKISALFGKKCQAALPDLGQLSFSMSRSGKILVATDWPSAGV
jgi:hypothetical protein